MTLKFNVPREKIRSLDDDFFARLHYVRVVPEATWRKIVKVLQAADKEYPSVAGPADDDIDAALRSLRKYLERKP